MLTANPSMDSLLHSGASSQFCAEPSSHMNFQTGQFLSASDMDALLPYTNKERDNSNPSTQHLSVKYPRSTLLAINHPSGPLPLGLSDRIKQLGIAVSQKRRGRRGGRRKQKKIQVVSGVYDHHKIHKRGANLNNLIQVCPKKQSSALRVGVWNAQSIRNKTEEAADLIQEEHLDILFVTESWLNKVGDEPTMTSVTPPGYFIKSYPRPKGRGGGETIIHKIDFQIQYLTELHHRNSTFKSTAVVVNPKATSSHFVFLYRPPPSKKTRLADLHCRRSSSIS